LVNRKPVFKIKAPPEIRRKLGIYAWADNFEYKIVAENIIVNVDDLVKSKIC
jgi:hypothetical protein